MLSRYSSRIVVLPAASRSKALFGGFSNTMTAAAFQVSSHRAHHGTHVQLQYHGAKPHNHTTEPAIVTAAKNGNVLWVTSLIQHLHADPNAADEHSTTALHYALRSGARGDLVEQLLAAGASCQHVRNSGDTCLHSAVRGHNPHMVKRVLECCGNDKSHLEHQTVTGQTPMMLAALLGDVEVVKLLIEAGCKHDDSHLAPDHPASKMLVAKALDMIKASSNKKGSSSAAKPTPYNSDFCPLF